MENQRSVRWDVAAVAMFAASALLWLSLLTHDAADNLGEFNGIVAAFYSPIHAAYPFNESIQNSCGYMGALASDALFQATGIGAYLVASLMILSGVVMLRQQPWASPMGRSIGWTMILVAVCSMPTRFGIQPRIPVPIGGGGYLGALCNTWMNQHLAQAGSVILVLTVFIGGLLLSTEYALIRYFGFAATGSMMALKWFRLPTWTMRRHAEMMSGTFSPSRSDLPKSVTLRQNPASITAGGSNHAGQTAYPSSVIHAAPLAGGSIGSNATIDTGESGPAIRIGRRAEASLTALDLASQSKAVGRTDLTFPKATSTLASIAGALFGSKKNSENEVNEVVDDEDDLQGAGSSHEIADHKTIVSGRKPVSPKVEYHDDDELDEDEEATVEDEEMEMNGDGEEENDDEVHSADDEDQIVVEPPKKRGAGRSRSIRSDAAHIEEDKGPRVKNRKEKTEVVDDSSPQLHEDLRAQLNDTKLPEGSEEYVLPGLDLLSESDEISYDEQTEEVKKKAKVLEQTFAKFGFNIRVVEIETGPVIAQYEIELEAGLRLSKITGLADDLAIALRVPSVRIVAPIPGKNSVGIEVPNEHRQIVRMREVIEESGPQVRKQKIPLFLGKDVSGKALTVDLASLPHLLIAGRTGTGKSVCLNSIISSILMTRRPDEVRMLMIDPKMVELSCYARLPHLMHPVVIDMRKAEAILAWAVDKMQERYELLARAGVRHLTNYNQLGREELLDRLKPENDEEAELIPDHLPFIVIVVDEMADLMLTSGKEVETHIIRLAAKSRAVGIHLILATQKPTVDVITGLIKSNLPARISFQVASRTDSRVVLDEMGADKLLGNGDMLFLWPGTSALVRGQGTYLSDDEINAVVDHCSMGEQNFVQELVQLKAAKDNEEPVKPGTFKKRDDLYEAAVDIVVREGRGSCSLLQRALGIGYGRAARLIDFMSEDGIVGQYNGSQARDVVITLAQWEEMRAGTDGAEEKPSKGRGNKIRRDDSWEETPKATKPKKKKRAEDAEEALVVAKDFEQQANENDWEDVD
ncbi:MAG: DNA translocase FtsK 4TM domain-containing protein [Planctomycetota bacterium]|nr:DNA translocase FtsK 4TM domain-containing protein [Planctomycetota bacterium]